MSFDIYYNAIKTPDGTVIASEHRHDFKTHLDKTTDQEYSVDGGLDYLKRLGQIADCTELSVTSDSTIEDIRKHFKWGSYGKDGTEELHHILLKDMDKAHIVAILKTQNHISAIVESCFEQELEFRLSLEKKD
jgi:hypothetical protein